MYKVQKKRCYLEGGVLQNTSNVIVEVSFYDYYEKNTSFMDVEKYLIPAGFKLS